ncbi:ATP-binding protein [Candidatus Magnetomorum sp. HK-1]|nr:ATP-binding protein [Candidatus Magnetomorum sp. HK-1]
MTNQIKKIEYTSKPAFINRKSELKYLQDRINRTPKDILFIYGPKSSGKTTLLMKFIDLHLNNKHYNIKHFNLRTVLVANYIDFIQAFFEVDYSKSSQEIKQRSEYSLKVFKLSKEIKQSLENKILDPFVVMKKELQKIVKKDKRPVIVIDELQALEDIYMNGQRELLKELFNFFVAITKESHLCHVIIASSDGYFMKRLFEDSKLAKTSTFYGVDYLNEADTKYWLKNLASESAIKSYILTDSQIDLIWKFIGGSMFEITKILDELESFSKDNKVSDEQCDHVIQEMIKENTARFTHYAQLSKRKIILLKEIYTICKKNIFFKMLYFQQLIDNNIYDNTILSDEFNKLVQLNFLAFNPTESTYQLQGKTMFYGLKAFVKALPERIEKMLEKTYSMKTVG